MGCVEKACIWPAEANGYCVHHGRMFEDMVGRYHGVRSRIRPEIAGFAEHILIHGSIFKREDKEPFSKSGFSLLGALEYDQNTDSVKCHECGEFRAKVGGTHLASHKVSVKEYRKKHGLASSTGLVGLFGVDRESIRHNRSSRATRAKNCEKGRTRPVRETILTVETQNARNKCRAQLLARLSKLGNDLGRTPTWLEIQMSGIYRPALNNVFGSASEALKLAGLEPRRRGHSKWRFEPGQTSPDAVAMQTPTPQ